MSDVANATFKKLTRQIGRLIKAEADKSMTVNKSTAKSNATGWVSAFVDARWFVDAEGWTAKLRVALPDGTFDRSLDVTQGMADILRKLSVLRKGHLAAEWYGLRVTVSHAGAITTDLNDDPNCVVDPTWFNS